MKNNVKYISLLLLLMVSVLSFSGCSKLFAPSDEEAIKAITASGVFKGGYGGLTLQPPVLILEKGGQNKDGSWPVKVKIVFTYFVHKDQVSAPVERTRIFNIKKVKDSSGHSVWKAEVGDE